MQWTPILSSDDEFGLSTSLSFDKEAASYEFSDAAVRLGFVHRVLGLLSVQLAAVTGLAAVFYFCEPVHAFVGAHSWLLWLALSLFLVLLGGLACVEKARRHHPLNLVALLAFTLCQSALLGTLSAVLDTPVALVAGGLSAGVVLALSLFAMQNRVDLTPSGGALLSLLLTLLLASILQSFIHVTWLQFFLSAGAALLFTTYLVLDIQLLLGSPHAAAALTPDEYVHGALSLYLDWINWIGRLIKFLNAWSQQSW